MGVRLVGIDGGLVDIDDVDGIGTDGILDGILGVLILFVWWEGCVGIEYKNTLTLELRSFVNRVSVGRRSLDASLVGWVFLLYNQLYKTTLQYILSFELGCGAKRRKKNFGGGYARTEGPST